MNHSTILMIRPVNFGFNEETAASNTFQQRDAAQHDLQANALAEFNCMVDTLRENGLEVIVFNDTAEPHTPDSIFPNNWVSFHETGQVFLYPMQAENRRLERRNDIIDYLRQKFTINEVDDLSTFEKEGKFLEGTGSMVLDRDFKIAYACLSPRTDVDVLNDFCLRSNYKPVCFHAYDALGTPIYHTNVLMCVGTEFVVICLDSITDPTERELLQASFGYTGKEIIEISLEQMNAFAGNMLELTNKAGEKLLVMSARARASLSQQQIEAIEQYCKIVDARLETIENTGGGSARCMIAEVSLPGKI